MSCYKILVLFVIAECCGHHILVRKEFEIKHDGQPFQLPFIQGKWIFTKAHAPGTIQKRELVSGPEILRVEAQKPAPTVEYIENEKSPEQPPDSYGFKLPIPMTRSVMNTNIHEMLHVENYPRPIPIPPHMLSELYGALPPQPIPAEPIPQEEIVSPPASAPEVVQNEPASTEAPRPSLFDKTKVRKYAVYAGDVILKYLSQFFNRARLTFNRITSPPPAEPEFQN